jgi:hypothetical protein
MRQVENSAMHAAISVGFAAPGIAPALAYL